MRLSLRRNFVPLLAFAWLATCSTRSVSSRRAAHESAGGSIDAVQRDASPGDVAMTLVDVVPPSELTSVIAAVRREAWREAQTQLEGLPPQERNGREGRYLEGRIAAALGDAPRAAARFHGLGELLPALRNDIDRREAEALARLSRHQEARALYEAVASRTNSARDRALAAEQAFAQGDHTAAAAVMRNWIQDPPSGFDRARAFRRAAEALEAINDRPAAIRAWKRLLVTEPDSSASATANAALTRLGAALNAEEIIERARELNERARYAEVISELTTLGVQTGLNETRRLHLLGRAYYGARSRYADASATLNQAGARTDNTDREEDLFLAARSLARADRDEEAVRAYDEVARTVRGRWGDEAAYRGAWLVAALRRTEEAITRFRAFSTERTSASEQQRTEAAWQLGWLLYRAGRMQEAIPAFEQSARIATRALERGRGRYWAGMAKARNNDREGSERSWRDLIADRPMTYYALLAEERLRERGITLPAPPTPAPRRPTVPVPLPEAARWLRALGFEREGGAILVANETAVRERLGGGRAADEAMAVSYLELGETHRAYALSQRHGDLLDQPPTAETRWVWDCSYPRPYAHWVEAAEDRNGLPRHYLYAIMRQESAFNSYDVSNARAIGLLQMIPPTTRRVAQELRIEYREELLFEPEYNVRVAGYYIGRLFSQYQGVLPRAIGAFNAGPGAMGRWVSRTPPEVEFDVFVEDISFDETRTYVRRVLQNLARYRYLYGPREGNGSLRLQLRGAAAVNQIVDY